MKAAMKAMKKRAAMKAPMVMKKRASMKASKVMKKQAMTAMMKKAEEVMTKVVEDMRVTEETAAMKDMPSTPPQTSRGTPGTPPPGAREYWAPNGDLPSARRHLPLQMSPESNFTNDLRRAAGLPPLCEPCSVQPQAQPYEDSQQKVMKKNAAKKADKNVMKKKAAMKAMKAMRAQRTRHKLDIKKMEAAKKAMKDCIAVIQGAFKNVVEARAHHVLPPEIEQYLNRSTNYLSMAAATIIGLPW